MVNRGVLDQEALLERVHDEVVIFNQLQLYHDIQETTEQTIARLMAKKNARQEASKKLSKKDRVGQNNANCLVTLDERDKQRRNRGQLYLQQYILHYEEPEEGLDYLESTEIGATIPSEFPPRKMIDITCSMIHLLNLKWYSRDHLLMMQIGI